MGGSKKEEAFREIREEEGKGGGEGEGMLCTFLNELQDSVLGVDVNHNQCSQCDTCLLW